MTGGSGFIGTALVKALLEQNHQLYLGLRASGAFDAPNKQIIPCAFSLESLPELRLKETLKAVDVVIHAAARVHVMKDKSKDPLSLFRRINTKATLDLARQAAEAGVKRFIFISTIKVNGEESKAPFSADDLPSPQDPYALSKYEAEKLLLALAAESMMEVVIIRPALVYGPGVKGNFKQMLAWLNKGLPFPVLSVPNQRSFIFLDNLVHLILTAMRHPKAANQIFLASDGEDLSTECLLTLTAQAFHKKARLVRLPYSMVKIFSKFLGQEERMRRLFGSLQVDIQKTSQNLDWVPKISLKEGLLRTAEAYLEE